MNPLQCGAMIVQSRWMSRSPGDSCFLWGKRSVPWLDRLLSDFACSSAKDNGCDTIIPFFANLMAGLITLRRGNDPKSFNAVKTHGHCLVHHWIAMRSGLFVIYALIWF